MNKGLNVGICGLGLIGGSLAKAFRKNRKVSCISAFDKNINSIKLALKDKVIDKGTTEDYTIFRDADIVFICTPINDVVNTAIAISKLSGALLTDTASTKKQIINNMPESIRFIGGHPMAGSENRGYQASTETLFENAVYIVCDNKLDEDDNRLLDGLIEMTGAIPLRLGNEEHDQAVGMVSHLPHIIASTLVNAVRAKDENNMLSTLAAGGFKDITRIASSDAALWEQILLSSEEAVINSINTYIEELDRLKGILEGRDRDRLIAYLEKAGKYREGIAGLRKGLLPVRPDLFIEVSDKPGIIGIITTLLGTNGINIKNLHIENSREYEGGSLRITLENTADLDRAVKLLNANNFPSRAR